MPGSGRDLLETLRELASVWFDEGRTLSARKDVGRRAYGTALLDARATLLNLIAESPPATPPASPGEVCPGCGHGTQHHEDGLCHCEGDGRDGLCPCGDIPHHPDCLHCAWDGVVAALPDETWWLHLVAWSFDDKAYRVEAATAGKAIHAFGPTPAASLTALRAALIGERG